MSISQRDDERHRIQCGRVVSNVRLCEEHYMVTLRVPWLGEVLPGQFVHLCPMPPDGAAYRVFDGRPGAQHDEWAREWQAPMLRRAFSIAGLRRGVEGVEVDVIYRVVGAATRWMASLSPGDPVSVLGPLGNSFHIHADKPVAWLVAGGVGLPPMLMLVEAVRRAGRDVVAFYGAQRRGLVALKLAERVAPDASAARAVPAAEEFARFDTPVVLSTDDGSVGFAGHVGAAMSAYSEANPIPSDQLVVYTCGPERMMEFVAEFCLARGIQCYVCMERAMACGTGTCQSCAVEVRDEAAPEGWRYELCCTDGPVFDVRRILWSRD